MFVEANVQSDARGERGEEAPVVVPATAPLFTGRRSVIYVEVPGTDMPTYEARVVTVGPRMGELYPVLSGLQEGERVVIHGAFAIDADLQIRGGPSMMNQERPH
jgi:Cu(I)/Ag(I) efflux system membrane fusion protein